MKLSLVTSISLFTIISGLLAEPISDDPVVSPKKSFAITQTHVEGNGYTTTVTFKNSRKSFVLQPSQMDWRGFYTVSPNERWILRIQKIGSGDDIAFLYEVKDEDIIPVQPNLGQTAWGFHEKVSAYENGSLYHTGFEFVAWDSSGNLVLKMHGSGGDQAHQVKDFVVKYNLFNKQFTKG